MIEDIFGFRIPARDRIADDDQIGFVGQILFGVAGNDFNLSFG